MSTDKKVHEVKFDLKAQDAENLWELFSSAQGAKLDPSAGVSWAAYELRISLEENQQEPDEDYDLILTPAGKIGSPKRQAYCKKHDLSLRYFPKTMEWVIPRRLLKILKLILKSTVASTTVTTFSNLVDLCKTLRLSAWFRANFKKVVTIELGEDDRDLDDELDDEEDEVDEEASDESAAPD